MALKWLVHNYGEQGSGWEIEVEAETPEEAIQKAPYDWQDPNRTYYGVRLKPGEFKGKKPDYFNFTGKQGKQCVFCHRKGRHKLGCRNSWNSRSKDRLRKCAALAMSISWRNAVWIIARDAGNF